MLKKEKKITKEYDINGKITKEIIEEYEYENDFTYTYPTLPMYPSQIYPYTPTPTILYDNTISTKTVNNDILDNITTSNIITGVVDFNSNLKNQKVIRDIDDIKR